MNIWKTLFISLVSAGLIIGGGVRFYNSDWMINKTMKVKYQVDKKIGNQLKWDYINKYDNGNLKIFIQLKNFDPKMINLMKRYFEDDENIVRVVFLDKDGYKLKEVPVNLKDIIVDVKKKNVCSIQIATKMSKNEVRQIYDVSPIYKTALDMTEKEFWQEIGY